MKNIPRIVKLYCIAFVWSIFLFATVFVGAGNNVFAQSRKNIENTIIGDTEIANFLDRIVASVSDKTDLKLYVVISDKFNAMATAKNVIGLYAGLFDRINDVEIFVLLIQGGYS